MRPRAQPPQRRAADRQRGLPASGARRPNARPVSRPPRAALTTGLADDLLTDLPMPPIGVAMVIKAASDPAVSLDALTSLIEKEPTVTTNLLTLANSAAYGVGHPVRSVGQATIYLGARAIRNIAVGHAVRAMMRTVDTGGLDLMGFWQDSLRRACAGLILARQAGYEDPSEAFTVGLIQDLGTLVMAAQAPEHGAALDRARRRPSSQRLAHERELFGKDHTEVFVGLGRSWGLPDDLIDAVAFHHEDAPSIDDRRTRRLAHLARAADAIADVSQTAAAGDTLVRARSIVDKLESRTKLDLESLVNRINQEMRANSAQLDIAIDEQPSYERLMEQANSALVQINYSYEELTQQLEQLLRDKEELARQLEASNEALKRLATVDPLTGVGNRRFFSDALDGVLAKLARDGQPLTIVTLDLDRFKLINDLHGHAAGDDVLVAVGRRLRANVRAGDVVGRLGGEEFGVLLPSCDAEDGRRVGERLRDALSSSPVRCRDGRALSITASFGGVTLVALQSADEALRACDQAMYRSKERGRDRVTWYDEV